VRQGGGSFLDRDGGSVLLLMIQSIHQNAKSLSEIDGAAGDGDHGINMDKGVLKCAERLQGNPAGFVQGLATLGDILLSEIGGSIGPLYGTFFREMAEAARGESRIDSSVLGRMLDRATAALRELSGAKLGDKTMMDALIPAVTAYTQVVASGAGLCAALRAMSDAAEQGKESTRNMVAKVGRSSRLGERSRGILDAGASSCALLLASMAEGIAAIVAKAS
jgi:dihydroxyacetone kinase-like protein